MDKVSVGGVYKEREGRGGWRVGRYLKAPITVI